jgi:hypothetical protein
MNVIPEPEPGTRAVILDNNALKPDPFDPRSESDIVQVCGLCEAKILAGFFPGQLISDKGQPVVIQCGRCLSFNETVMDEPGAA